MTNREGQQLGNYRLARLLGEGGFAQVYLGEHIHLETQAAVKVLHTQVDSNKMKLFRKEARTIARLEHPHIVRVLEFGIENDSPYLVMTYAPNGTLRQRHPKGEQLPLKVILPYIEQVAEALQYIHDQKLIHRDVKLENLLLDSSNNILLSDFGIASVAHTTVSLTTQGQAGTPHYMAPEQVQGKPLPASDQYALGVVVYEWLCGIRPFQGEMLNIFFQHLHTPPPALRERLSTIPPLVEVIVLKALAKDPKQRFASVKAFANALKQASKAEQTTPSIVLGTSIASSFTTRMVEEERVRKAREEEQARRAAEEQARKAQASATGQLLNPTPVGGLMKKWAYQTGGEIIPSPVVVGGVVYVGSSDGNLYALDAATGTKKWDYRTGDVADVPVVVGGVLYVGSNDHNLYAFHLPGT